MISADGEETVFGGIGYLAEGDGLQLRAQYAVVRSGTYPYLPIFSLGFLLPGFGPKQLLFLLLFPPEYVPGSPAPVPLPEDGEAPS